MKKKKEFGGESEVRKELSSTTMSRSTLYLVDCTAQINIHLSPPCSTAPAEFSHTYSKIETTAAVILSFLNQFPSDNCSVAAPHFNLLSLVLTSRLK